MEQHLKDKIQAFLADNPNVNVIFIDANGDLHTDNVKAVEVAISIDAGDPKVTEIDIVGFLADEEAAKKAAEEQAQKEADALAAEALKKQQSDAEASLAEVEKKSKSTKPQLQKGDEKPISDNK